MNAKKSIVDKYYPIWEGGKSVERVNPKVGFCIRLYCINQMNAAFQKNKDLFSDEDREKMIKMITEFKETKAQISEEDQKCTLEDYQVFLDKFFTNLDYEDRHETVTLKTSNKFRLMAGFIDVLTTFGPLDDEMKKCKKYCAFKAIDIFKELKRGEVPKRGGPKEEENSKQKQKLEENSTKLKENAKLLKEKDIALLKLLMKAEKLDFDEAFNTLKLSENLRASYKKEIYGE